MRKLRYVIVFVSDMKRSVAFYRDVLGYPLKFESPGWSELEVGSATLALHPAGQRPAGACVPGLMVPDLDEFDRQMEANGVKCLDPPRWRDFGARLAVYADPDGLALSVGEGSEQP